MQTKPNECYIKTLHNLPNSYGEDTNQSSGKNAVPISMKQKLNYMHDKPCRGKWNLLMDVTE